MLSGLGFFSKDMGDRLDNVKYDSLHEPSLTLHNTSWSLVNVFNIAGSEVFCAHLDVTF